VIKYELPSVDLIDLMARCLAVVIPLENRLISIGQSVLLQAMTLGKAVIVTRVNGTEDYLEHMETGIFVPPNDPGAIAAAVSLLVGDEALRKKLGRAAQDRVKRMYLPRHYANEVSALLQ
jgi:glycosyltransferase involved in cell wall biosynthesis